MEPYLAGCCVVQYYSTGPIHYSSGMFCALRRASPHHHSYHARDWEWPIYAFVVRMMLGQPSLYNTSPDTVGLWLADLLMVEKRWRKRRDGRTASFAVVFEARGRLVVREGGDCVKLAASVLRDHTHLEPKRVKSKEKKLTRYARRNGRLPKSKKGVRNFGMVVSEE